MPDNPQEKHVILLTGLSGSGKSCASRALEDAGYYCVDNLPVGLIPELLDTLVDKNRVAISADARSLQFKDFQNIWLEVKRRFPRAKLIFLWAEPEILERRYKVTRRPHPMQENASTLLEAIQEEMAAFSMIRKLADSFLDTTLLSVHQLRTRILKEYGEDEQGEGGSFLITVVSFGFAYGLPGNVDVVMDVRFLPNPHFVPELQPKTGLESDVYGYVIEREETQRFYEKMSDYLAYVIEQVEEDNRSYFGIGIGCTGGRHRSVAIAEKLASSLREQKRQVMVLHRDISREGPPGKGLPR